MILIVNSVNKFIAVMVKCGVLFEVRAEFYLDELRLQRVNQILCGLDFLVRSNTCEQCRGLPVVVFELLRGYT
jgi:hypothetical protein